MDPGSVFRRCGCRHRATGRLLGTRCPRLHSVRHGSWYFGIDLPSAGDGRRRVRSPSSWPCRSRWRRPAAMACPPAGWRKELCVLQSARYGARGQRDQA